MQMVCYSQQQRIGTRRASTITDSNINIKALIQKAWEGASSSHAQTHKDRAKAWIECLGKGFQKQYSNEEHRVFWRNNCDNSDFELNELLFDISVCQIGWVKSIVHCKPLPYIAKSLWQVESEFDNSNSREITKDFSKLVMGCSENQLFISTYQGDLQKKALTMCSSIARCCNGNLYMCFVEHPDKWSKDPKGPSLFKWEENGWRDEWDLH